MRSDATVRFVLRAALLCAVARASPVRADCAIIHPEVIVPFADAALPQDAELRFVDPLTRGSVEVTLPDGTVAPVDIEVDAISQRVALPTPLALGVYVLTLSRDVISFSVVNDRGTQRPDAPAVNATRQTHWLPPSPPFTECPKEAGFKDEVTLDIQGDHDASLVVIDGALAARAGADGFTQVIFREARGGALSYDVSVRDFAGHESDVAKATVWGGCEGGCSSAAPLQPLAAILLFMRRGPPSRQFKKDNR